MRPLLVIVCGAPGSGKTELSRQIAGSLMLPLLSKDLIKEALMDSEPVTERNRSMAIGKTSFALLFQLAGALLRHGPGLVLEAPFGPTSSPELSTFSRIADTALIVCTVPADAAVSRYRARFLAGTRHPGHQDAAVLRDLRARIESGQYDPPALSVSTLRVDTSDGYQPPIEAVVAWIRSQHEPDDQETAIGVPGSTR